MNDSKKSRLVLTSIGSLAGSLLVGGIIARVIFALASALEGSNPMLESLQAGLLWTIISFFGFATTFGAPQALAGLFTSSSSDVGRMVSSAFCRLLALVDGVLFAVFGWFLALQPGSSRIPLMLACAVLGSFMWLIVGKGYSNKAVEGPAPYAADVAHEAYIMGALSALASAVVILIELIV